MCSLYTVAAICPKSWGVQSRGHLSLSVNPPFSCTLVDSAWIWAEPVHLLPNILMQFTQSNSFIRFTFMFNVLPCTENSVHATAELILWITSHVEQHGTKKGGSVHTWTPHCQKMRGSGPQDPHRIAATAYRIQVSAYIGLQSNNAKSQKIYWGKT